MGENTVVIEPLALYEGVIHPSYVDLLPGDMNDPYGGFLSEFYVMDNVNSKRPMVDIFQKFNILQRRDASCDLNYKKIMGTAVRSIEVSDVYGATQHCRHEFYQGALRDWDSKDELFGPRILPFFKNAMRIDMASNCWFGDVERAPSTTFSTNVYNGVFQWLAHYTNNGLIPSAQTLTAPTTDVRQVAHCIDAYNLIIAMVAAQPPLLRAIPGNMKALYVDQAILDGYREYMRQLGTTSLDVIDLYNNGAVMATAINGIPIIGVPIWEPILFDLNGGTHHAAILTIRKNFVFGTDKEYGEGPDGKDALMVWYERKYLSWYYQMFLRAGTQIGYPEFVVYAV